jgi:adenylate kinase family enzyme
VAVFGNAGGGKSTLARELAAITGLPLHVLDKLHGEIPYEEYLQAHTTLVDGDEWIIDGFGFIQARLAKA